MSSNVSGNSFHSVGDYTFEKIDGKKLLDIKRKGQNGVIGSVALHKTRLHKGSVGVQTSSGKKFYIKQADFDAVIDAGGGNASVKRKSQLTVSQNDNISNQADNNSNFNPVEQDSLKDRILAQIKEKPYSICCLEHREVVKNNQELFIEAAVCAVIKGYQFKEEHKDYYISSLTECFKKDPKIVNNFIKSESQEKLETYFEQAIDFLILTIGPEPKIGDYN